ncbi:MAG: flagellar protein FlaG [Solirubrobacteraceae bacterium]
MSLEIGPLPPIHPTGAPRRAAETPAVGFSLDLARVDTAELSLPPSPPPEVLDEIGAAADRVDALAAANRELHFSIDEDTNRVVIQVRELDGTVIRTIPPSAALDVMAGAGV